MGRKLIHFDDGFFKTGKETYPEPFSDDEPHQHSYTIPVAWTYEFQERVKGRYTGKWAPCGASSAERRRCTLLACPCGNSVKEVKYE